MPKEIWVAGFPSRYGGADTELDHQIDLWRACGAEVHLVPMFGADPAMREDVLRRGCHVHEYRDDVFRDRTVASWCNGQFLERLPAIAAAGKPRQVLWFNCMTYLFDSERIAHARGLIDRFGFVSRHQRRCLGPQLEAIRPFQEVPYQPYFNASRVEWRYREWGGCYRVGRISRDDGNKFAVDTWRIFERVLVPAGVEKKVYILGYGPNAAAKIGPAPGSLDWRTWSPNEIPSADFYRTVDTMVHKTGGSGESYCRVLVEAYAHGAVAVVEDAFAFPELVIHGETGFLGKSSDELSHWASALAFNPKLHRKVAENARAHLETALVDAQRCWKGWEEILSM